jgi:hypothetical protein
VEDGEGGQQCGGDAGGGDEVFGAFVVGWEGVDGGDGVVVAAEALDDFGKVVGGVVGGDDPLEVVEHEVEAAVEFGVGDFEGDDVFVVADAEGEFFLDPDGFGGMGGEDEDEAGAALDGLVDGVGVVVAAGYVARGDPAGDAVGFEVGD